MGFTQISFQGISPSRTVTMPDPRASIEAEAAVRFAALKRGVGNPRGPECRVKGNGNHSEYKISSTFDDE